MSIGATRPIKPPDECDEAALDLYLSGPPGLQGEELLEFLFHIDICDRCRGKIQEARTNPENYKKAPPPKPAPAGKIT